MSTALVGDDQLVAVLTAYSPEEEPFLEDHRRIFEEVGSTLLARLSSLSSKVPSEQLSVPVRTD